MIGSALKKYAVENGMNVREGVAYGVFHGYAATFCEGSGFKQMTITTHFSDPAQRYELDKALNQPGVTSQYNVRNLLVAPNCLTVVFNDTVGTMKKIKAFVDFLMPLLDTHGAAKAEVCSECGGLIQNDGVWMLRDNTAAFYVHEACGRRVQETLEAENTRRKEEENGSYLSGVVGAVIGAALGAVVWAILLMLGYIVGLVGLLIGFLAEKGYTLLKGKQGKAKIAILIIAVIFGVLLGTAAGTCLQVVQVINENQLDMAFFPDIMSAVLEDGDVQGEIAANVLIGLLFAGIGVFGMLYNESKKLSGEKVKFLR